MTTPEQPPESHEGQLSLWDAISIIIGIVIGTSIFYVPQLIFSNTANPWIALGTWAFGGVLAIVGAFCYAELVSTYPRSGGSYEYLSRGFGPGMGFLFGWGQLTLITPANTGAMAYVFATYAAGFWNICEALNLGLPCDFVYASLVIIVLTAINILGVTLGKTTQNILTATKILGIGGILLAGFLFAQPEKWTPQQASSSSNMSWALAVIFVLYCYGGWNDSAFVAAEVKNQKRNMPIALILGTVAILLIYLLINIAYILGLGFTGAQQGSLLPVELLERTPLGKSGGILISVLVMISALGAANAMIFTSPRVYATMGMDHQMFAFLGRWRPGRGTPVSALLLQGFLSLLLITLLGTAIGNQVINRLLGFFGLGGQEGWTARSGFETLVSHTSPVFWIFFLLTGISLFLLRWRNPEKPRPFSVPFYPVLPLIFCGMCIFMLYQSIIYVEWRSLLGIGVLCLAIPLYFVSRGMGRGKK